MKAWNSARRFPVWFLIGPLSLLVACATPHYDARNIPGDGVGLPHVVRLHDVAFPLLVAAADWCNLDQESTYGFLVMEVEPSGEEGSEEVGSRIAVVYVHPQSPAADAGLIPGDRLIRVNERTVVGFPAEEVSRLIRRITIARIQPLQLDLVRDGRRHMLHLWAVPACQYSVQLIPTDLVNGIADGTHIGVTTGAMRFVESEDELAWVVAHEIAHNVLNHSQNARLRAMLDRFLRATLGATAEASTDVPRRSIEAQADYIGAYVMARAGYDVRAIKRFWRRMEHLRSEEKSRDIDGTHPTTAERLAALDMTLKEIEAKRQRGEALQPMTTELP